MTNTRRTLIVSITLFLLSAGGYGYLSYEIFHARRNTVTLEEKIVKSKQLSKSEGALADLFEESKEDRAAVFSAIVEDGGLVRLIESIEASATRSGVRSEIENITEGGDITTVTTGESGNTTKAPHPANKTFALMTLDVSATGSWFEVFSFFKDIESLPYASEIESVFFEKTIISGEDGGSALPSDPEGASGGEGTPPEPREVWQVSLTMSVVEEREAVVQ